MLKIERRENINSENILLSKYFRTKTRIETYKRRENYDVV
jgi:hypothetical protein